MTTTLKPGRPADRKGAPLVWTIILVLIATVIVFAVIRVLTDLPLVFSGEAAEDGSFEQRYVRWAVPAYLHIVPGIIYIVGACFQLSRRFRTRHLAIHRRMGRVVLGAGLISGIFALVFGAPNAYGGFWESVATILFSSYFLLALGLALRAILRRDVTAHRRWMIRAFAIGLAVGTIRLWVGLFMLLGIFDLEGSFAPAFWIAFTMHAIAAELWLRWRPGANGRVKSGP
jgi:uncharacterized membrane protein YozB (DUF420 family)